MPARTLYIRQEYFGAIVYEPVSARYFNIAEPLFDAILGAGEGSLARHVAPFYPPGWLQQNHLPRLRILRTRNVGGDVLSAPLKVFFNITKRCNLYCAHCYNDSGRQDSPELDLKTITRTIDTLCERGIFKVTLAGGEPLYHPHFDDILACLADTDLAVSIVTNGICISDQRAERIAENANIRSITISLDGASAAENDLVRGAKAYARALTGVRRLRERFKGPLTLRVTLMKSNIANMPAYVDLAESLGIEDIKVNAINAYGRAQEQGALLLDHEDYVRARQVLFDAASRSNITVEVPAHKYQKDGNGQLGLCRAGEETCEIDGDGILYPCSFTFGRLAAGNLRTEPHATVFENLQRHTINNSWCYKCKGRGGNAEKVFGHVPDLIHAVQPAAE